jgi:hypothetical protein
LPIFLEGTTSVSAQALARPVTFKRNIEAGKAAEMLMGKGMEQFMRDGKIEEGGREFICGHMQTVCEEMVGSASKPVDPKKEPKSTIPGICRGDKKRGEKG